MSIQVTKDKNALACLRRTMQKAWWGDSNAARYAQPPTILNGEFVTGVNAANTAVINIIGVDANNNVVLPDGSSLSYATVNVSAAQIIAMFTTPVTIVAAPGAGKAIIVSKILFQMTRTATAFTGGGALEFDYHGSTIAHTGTVASTVVTTAGAAVVNVVLGNASATGVVVPANLGIDLTNVTAVFAAGTGTAKVQIWYSIVTL